MAAADQTIARKDEPLVRHLRRGTTTDALAALEEKGATALVDVLLKDRYAKGTAEANASLVRTWHHFHEEAFGHAHPPVPVLPLTTRTLVMIGSLFKAGGYRSYPNYVSIMKTKHIEDGHEWGQLIQHTSAWVTRSVMRGIGPDRQSCSFDVPKLCALPRGPAPLTDLGPCNPYRLAILATLFLLREVEVTTARVSAWKISTADKELTWHLPGSKTDHMALGVERTLPCFCGLEALPCPYHLALEHLHWLRVSKHSDEGTAILFPTANGTVSSKAAVITTFETLGEYCGQPLLTEHGLRKFGGHTPRVSGSRFYAALGLETNKIRIMARRSGDTILRYIQEAPLKSIRSDLGIALQGRSTKAAASSSSACSSAMVSKVTALEAKLEELERTIQVHAQELTTLNEAAKQDTTTSFIQNIATATVHVTSPTSFGRARCGWKFDGPTYRSRRQISAKSYRPLENLDDIPGDMICGSCLPQERLAALNKDIIHNDLSGDDQPVEV